MKTSCSFTKFKAPPLGLCLFPPKSCSLYCSQVKELLAAYKCVDVFSFVLEFGCFLVHKVFVLVVPLYYYCLLYVFFIIDFVSLFSSTLIIL